METHEISFPHEPSENFKFKYVAEEELLRIVRKVRREKQKEKDALLWKCFIEEREKNTVLEVQQGNAEELLSAPPSCHRCVEVCNNEKKDTIKPIMESYIESIPSEMEDAHFPLKRLLPPDGVATGRETGSLQRIALLRHRINHALDSITGMVQCRPAEPDGPDDFERRKTRLNEFLSRFSRNYLFQFQRQVAELRRHIANASPETPGRHTEYQALMQKLVSAHQTALQSLQAYLTQIPASLQVTNIFGKLKDLLLHLCDLSSLKTQLDIYAGLMDGCEDVQDTDEVYLKCRELLTLLEEKRIEQEDVCLSAQASSPVSARGSLNPKTQRGALRSNSGVPHSSWKKTSVHLARAKFGAPSSGHSSVSARVSSRGRHSLGEKTKKDAQTYSCCNSELKEIITHMHDVICNKAAAKKNRKSRHCKSAEHNNAASKRKATCSEKPLNEVQNLSNNVQLVITHHCDSESDGFKDATTDTADLNDEDGKLQHNDGESKKSKRVVWTTGDNSLSKDTKDSLFKNVNGRVAHSKPYQQREKLPDNGDSILRLRKAPQQRVFNYRHRFEEYNSKVQNPSIQKWCEDILDGVFHEISEELEPSFLLEKMYHLEFKDAC